MIAKAVSNQSRFFHYKVSFVHASKDNLMLSTSNKYCLYHYWSIWMHSNKVLHLILLINMEFSVQFSQRSEQLSISRKIKDPLTLKLQIKILYSWKNQILLPKVKLLAMKLSWKCHLAVKVERQGETPNGEHFSYLMPTAYFWECLKPLLDGSTVPSKHQGNRQRICDFHLSFFRQNKWFTPVLRPTQRRFHA